MYTDSNFSTRHLDPAAKKIRTQTRFLTAANLTKMYLGIAFITVPKSVEQAGLYGSIVGFAYIISINLFCLYILVKARNRFKREPIVDICDLGARLFGEGIRPLISLLLCFTNGLFLCAYVLFYGSQIDQLVCKTFKARECGYSRVYSAYVILSLLPFLFLRRMANIGYFSVFALILTFVSIGIVIYMSIVILGKTPQEVQEEYHIKLTDDDRDYNYWNSSMIPVFCVAMMTLFEANQMILNIYSEADRPQDFFVICVICIATLTVGVAMVTGYLGYLAFGSTTKSVILYNLPNEDPLSVTAKICYVIAIMGSFVLIIQPIFYVIESSSWYNSVRGKKEEAEPK